MKVHNKKNRQSQKDHEYPSPDSHAGSQEEPYPARNGEQRRQRIQPHFKREALWRPTAAQEHYSHGLADELNDEPHGQDGGNDRLELEKQREEESESAKE